MVLTEIQPYQIMTSKHILLNTPARIVIQLFFLLEMSDGINRASEREVEGQTGHGCNTVERERLQGRWPNRVEVITHHRLQNGTTARLKIIEFLRSRFLKLYYPSEVEWVS